MTYVEVINTTENEITLRPPWNQGDHFIIPPGGSCQAPETWVEWCRGIGLYTTAELEKVWQESGLEAAAEEVIKATEPEESDPPDANVGVLFDSAPGKPAKKGKR